MSVEHHGFMIAGEFHRGRHRGGGQVVNAAERDRIRALQLMQQAMPGALEDDNRREGAEFFLSLARMLLNNRGHSEAWRLQYLSDLSVLPDALDEDALALSGYARNAWSELVAAAADAEDIEARDALALFYRLAGGTSSR